MSHGGAKYSTDDVKCFTEARKHSRDRVKWSTERVKCPNKYSTDNVKCSSEGLNIPQTGSNIARSS